jgi:hypothetical protein
MRVPGLTKLKNAARVRRRRQPKVSRVASVRVDQLVTCPGCDNPMHLTEFWKFSCKKCMQELTAEQALTALSDPGL